MGSDAATTGEAYHTSLVGSGRAPVALGALARWELATKHPEQALEFARRGVSLDVACLSCYELAAEASFRGRDYDGALRWQRQAVNLAAEHVSKGSLDRLARFERAKKAPPAPTPQPKLDDEAQAVHDAMKARRPEFDAC